MNMPGYIGEVQGMSNETASDHFDLYLDRHHFDDCPRPRLHRHHPILIGVIAGYILSFFMGVVDLTRVQEVLVCLADFYKPEFNLSAIAMISMPALFVVLAEHLGHLFVTSDIVGRDLIADPAFTARSSPTAYQNVLSGLVGSDAEYDVR